MSQNFDTGNYLKNVNMDQKNSAVPKPPKPGEMMYCQQCGRPMPPESFSKSELIRRREFKWQMHHACMMELQNRCDRYTPGLLSERNQRGNSNHN